MNKTNPTEKQMFARVCAPNTVKALRQKQQLTIDSMTGVNPVRTHGIGVWGNERVVMSVRVDKGLKKAFKTASAALFGSTCNPIESWMAGIVGIYQNQKMRGVNPSITVNVGDIRIERNLRERRKLTRTHTEVDTVEEETEIDEAVNVVEPVHKCSMCGCVIEDRYRFKRQGWIDYICSVCVESSDLAEDLVRVVENKAIDYHGLDVEGLRSCYIRADMLGDTSVKNCCLAEARLRGVSL